MTNYSTAAPAHDAQGRPCWNIWASLPGKAEVTVTTGSLDDMIAVATFLAQEGYGVLTDAIAKVYTLTITRRGGATETREFADRREALNALDTVRGNLLVRDAVLTNTLGREIAAYHC